MKVWKRSEMMYHLHLQWRWIYPDVQILKKEDKVKDTAEHYWHDAA